ncbi:hypothetical protein AML91_17890 [Paenibacillus jilunlii]|uniref:Uncharacterized protein n=1 Tax=Paenibacillus jilunlii TaxID=682956 RepID=A0ABR5SSR4_9BACL|nr:hypothetical protein AML91_17890 [Paenibacillus jilunlii]
MKNFKRRAIMKTNLYSKFTKKRWDIGIVLFVLLYRGEQGEVQRVLKHYKIGRQGDSYRKMEM